MWDQVVKSVNKTFRVMISTVKEKAFNNIVEASRKGHFKMTDKELSLLREVMNAGIDDAVSLSSTQLEKAIRSVEKEVTKK